MVVSENNIPRLQQIITVALRHGTSIRQIVNKLEDALEDIATLIYRLGGRQLLFALNQKLSLPSLRTLRTHASFTTITPTIGPIRDEHIHANIHTIVLATQSPTSPKRGVSLMIDEIALEEMAIHFSKYNQHSHLVDPVLHTYESAVNIAQKIHAGQVHLGKELTVIGASFFGEDDIYPLLAAPTCKAEDATDMEQLLARVINCWSIASAGASAGPIWSFTMDGDATRCAAGHKLFLKNALAPELPLYGTLINMLGLNLFTGDGKVTLDFDYKHILKRICTLIRSPSGIVLNNGCIINSMMLACYLVWLPAYDEAAVMKLLHPDDPQDVPCAVELILAIIHNLFSMDIDTHADLKSITLLSVLIESFLTPFINTMLSLFDQIQYLSRYSHIAFTFFHAHQRSFMSYQLYYDTQTAVKNIIFCCKKQQILDPNAPFYCYDLDSSTPSIQYRSS
ncbi:hypothetical protein EDD22DRAFT_982574 [Suillus occidentalis]|nr:hypothetical protein EDD22DRAFT_982574 [Suillus occidentalis]